MLTTTLKPKECEACGSMFTPRSTFARACRMVCARKVIAADKKAVKANDKARRANLETIPELIKKADIEFGAFIRERDRLAGRLCISSGKPLDWNAGNQVDAGHYRSKGAASHLRYDEDNCHAQTKQQNRFKAGNAVDYRVHLIARIGLERVEALESNNTPCKWDRDTLRQIAVIYRAKLRAMKKEHDA